MKGERKMEQVESIKKVTRASLALQAKERGIKNFGILNKKELEIVLGEGISIEDLEEVLGKAVTRWKDGWGKGKHKKGTSVE